MPLLHVDTVVDAIVDTLDSGLSETILPPEIWLGEFILFPFVSGSSLTDYVPCTARSSRLVSEIGPEQHKIPESRFQGSTGNRSKDWKDC
jgi:hypothetical protein